MKRFLLPTVQTVLIMAAAVVYVLATMLFPVLGNPWIVGCVILFLVIWMQGIDVRHK